MIPFLPHFASESHCKNVIHNWTGRGVQQGRFAQQLVLHVKNHWGDDIGFYYISGHVVHAACIMNPCRNPQYVSAISEWFG